MVWLSQDRGWRQWQVWKFLKGRDAVDAVVTIGFVMAVTLPRAGNIGGGGFMLIKPADSDEVIAVDYREKAPPKLFVICFWIKMATLILN